DDAALPVPFVDAHHHAVGIEAGALALGKAVVHALRAHDAGIVGLLHRLADLLLVGRAGTADGVGHQHDAVVAVAVQVGRLFSGGLLVCRLEFLGLGLVGVVGVDTGDSAD